MIRIMSPLHVYLGVVCPNLQRVYVPDRDPGPGFDRKKWNDSSQVVDAISYVVMHHGHAFRLETGTMLTRTPSTTTLDEERWRAVVNRDRAYEGKFVLAVHTTGIFCRPGCPARTPKRENISFFDTTADALRAGFRPCKRCRPLVTSISEDHARMVESAIRAMEQSDSRLTLEALVAHVGMSPWHFQRIFRQQTGLTPAQYQRSLRSSRIRDELQAAPTVTEAMNNAGYGSSSQFYAATEGELGMRPSSYRAGGKGERIRY